MSETKKKNLKAKKQTDQEKIFGEPIQYEANGEIDYESQEINYRVTDLEAKGTPTIVDGTVIEAFIGSNNREARQALKKGTKEVITKDIKGKEIYKIEVMN